jgi:hypothetical protein
LIELDSKRAAEQPRRSFCVLLATASKSLSQRETAMICSVSYRIEEKRYAQKRAAIGNFSSQLRD